MQVGPGLVLVALAGFALGGCGGGGSGTGALATRTGLTQTAPTRTAPTRTTPTRDTPTQTVTTSDTTTETATTAETTTEVATTAETTTETVTTGETTNVQHVAPPPTTTAGESSSSSNTPWGWIALGLGLLAGLVIALILWHRHRAGAAEWGAETADLNRRSLVALDDVLAKGSVVTGRIEALAAEARSLETRAPDDPSRAAAGLVRERLDELAVTLETDRALRLGSPPPRPEQLSYSTALIQQQAAQLQGVLRPPGTAQVST